MKIALFTDTYPPQVNGVATVVQQTARGLNHLGHETAVVTLSAARKNLPAQPADAFPVIRLPSLPFWGYHGERFTAPLGLTLKSIKKFQPDLIHVHTPFAVGWEAILCAKHFGLPLVGTHHTFLDHYLKHIKLDFAWTQKLSWQYVAAFYERCDLVLSPSHALSLELLAHGMHQPLQLLPNPVKLDQFQPAATDDTRLECRSRLGLDGQLIAYMGRLSYEKSLDQVLSAFGQVADQLPSAKLLMIGDGPEKEKLKKMASARGLSHRVIFTGALFGQELAQTMAACDVFVTASKSENHPVSVLEAMASGLPVVAVRSGGLPEIVTNGLDGLLVAPDKPAELADGLSSLLADEALRLAMAKAARQRALDFGEDKIINDLLAQYQRLLRSKSAA